MYKRQEYRLSADKPRLIYVKHPAPERQERLSQLLDEIRNCLLYTSDAADERSSVDLGGRRIIKKKKKENNNGRPIVRNKRDEREVITWRNSV